MDKEITALIRWLTPLEGGRTAPPSGPTYSTVLDICTVFGTLFVMAGNNLPDNDDEPGQSIGFWEVVFYRTEAGNEPVREWLKSLRREDRKVIGEDVKTVQFGWPLGMPLVRKVEPYLWEVRSHIKDGIARVLFTVLEDKIVLLHGFIKKSQKTPQSDLDTAKRRLISLEMRDEE